MAADSLPFNSLYRHGYARVCACVPRVRVAEPAIQRRRNAGAGAGRRTPTNCVLALFPELGLSAYSNEDLFHQDALLDAAEQALARVVRESERMATGAGRRRAAAAGGEAVQLRRRRPPRPGAGRRAQDLPAQLPRVLREAAVHVGQRRLSSARCACRPGPGTDEPIPFGSDLLFEASDLAGFVLHAEICEDVWTPIPPSTWGALAGATVLANLSASNITIGKAAYRRDLCASQSGRCIAAYLYTAAGQGESTTDLAWDGHAMIYENGNLLAESERFSDRRPADHRRHGPGPARARNGSAGPASTTPSRSTATAWPPCGGCASSWACRAARCRCGVRVRRFPYVPHDLREWDERCFETYNIQVAGLEQRLRASGIQKIVIGVSGGLDSTQALIVAVPDDGPARAAAGEHPGLHHARLRHHRHDQVQRLETDEGAEGVGRRRSTSARRACRCSRTWATRSPGASRSTT